MASSTLGSSSTKTTRSLMGRFARCPRPPAPPTIAANDPTVRALPVIPVQCRVRLAPPLSRCVDARVDRRRAQVLSDRARCPFYDLVCDAARRPLRRDLENPTNRVDMHPPLRDALPPARWLLGSNSLAPRL